MFGDERESDWSVRVRGEPGRNSGDVNRHWNDDWHWDYRHGHYRHHNYGNRNDWNSNHWDDRFLQ